MDEKRLLKVDKDLMTDFRMCVFILYDGDTYGNQKSELEKALKNHIALMKSRMSPEQKKKHNIT